MHSQGLAGQSRRSQRVNGIQRDLGAGVGIGHGAHLQAVGDDDAVEAELAAQEIGDDL